MIRVVISSFDSMLMRLYFFLSKSRFKDKDISGRQVYLTANFTTEIGLEV